MEGGAGLDLNGPVIVVVVVVTAVLTAVFTAHWRNPQNRGASVLLRDSLEGILQQNTSSESDACFAYITQIEEGVSAKQGTPTWGEMLDAGTGSYSLQFLTKQAAASGEQFPQAPKPNWTAITADPEMFDNILAEYNPSQLKRPEHHHRMPQMVGLPEGNSLVLGKWSDPDLVGDRKFDTVLLDYLVGAVDGFEPYTQHKIFPRIRRTLKPGGRLYFVGMAPHPTKHVDAKEDPHGELIQSIAKLRDACISLCGGRPYREYPMEWTIDHLKEAGFRVIGCQSVPIRQSYSFVIRQLNVARQYLGSPKAEISGSSLELRRALLRQVEGLFHIAGKLSWNGVFFGEDYTIAAVPNES